MAEGGPQLSFVHGAGGLDAETAARETFYETVGAEEVAVGRELGDAEVGVKFAEATGLHHGSVGGVEESRSRPSPRGEG